MTKIKKAFKNKFWQFRVRINLKSNLKLKNRKQKNVLIKTFNRKNLFGLLILNL